MEILETSKLDRDWFNVDCTLCVNSVNFLCKVIAVMTIQSPSTETNHPQTLILLDRSLPDSQLRY